MKNVYLQDIQELEDGFTSGLFIEHGRFDKVFSNAVLHWCKRDPVGVVRGSKKLLKAGGIFVAEFGGWGNCAGADEISIKPQTSRDSAQVYALLYTPRCAGEAMTPRREIPGTFHRRNPTQGLQLLSYSAFVCCADGDFRRTASGF